MSSSTSLESISSDLGRKKWMKTVKKMLEDEGTRICVHKVPKRLRARKPDAYNPQCIGLGPYHHWSKDLYVMEQYKLIASKKLLKDCNTHEEAIRRLTILANSLKKDHICRIHASYDCFLDMDDKAIAWMMIIDAMFLLHFLQVIAHPKETKSLSVEGYYLMDPKKPTYHLILQDIMKLENQIPFILAYVLLSSSRISIEQHALPSLLHEFCKKLNPFIYNLDCKKLNPFIYNLDLRHDDNNEYTPYHHLLDLLYHMIVPEQSSSNSSSRTFSHSSTHENNNNNNNNNREEVLPRYRRCLDDIPIPDCGTLRRVRPPTHNNLFHFLSLVICNPITTTIIVVPIKSLCQRLWNTSPELGGGSSSSPGGSNSEAPEVVDEIDIPSVSNLLHVGVKFHPLHNEGSITSIKFDTNTRQFYLPVITMDANTEVVLRNLVAYEAVGISGPSVLARYTELMNGIIDTIEDVKHLKERKILLSETMNDGEVAEFWNGMSRSIKLLSNHGRIDKAIKDVKVYYDNKRRVKFVRFTRNCMFCGWKISMLLLTLLLVVLMIIQSFCDVYNCPQAVRSVAAPQSSAN